MKEADKQAKAQLEAGDLGKDKYDALQREIVETESKLEDLKKEAGSGSAKLAEVVKNETASMAIVHMRCLESCWIIDFIKLLD